MAPVKGTIAYNVYDADFNMSVWHENQNQINEEQKKVTEDFIKMQTIDCPSHTWRAM